MGKGLGGSLIAYLDTNVAAWLSHGRVRNLTKEAHRVVRTADLLLSPMVMLELEYLYDLRRSKLRARDVLRKLQDELQVTVCTLSFERVADTAIDEGWTTDPFDRLIVANAKANAFAPLVSADEQLAAHYPKTVW